MVFGDGLRAQRLADRIARTLIEVDAIVRQVALGLLPITSQRVLHSFPTRRVLVRPPSRLPECVSHESLSTTTPSRRQGRPKIVLRIAASVTAGLPKSVHNETSLGP